MVSPPSLQLLPCSPLDSILLRLKLQQLERKVQPKGQDSAVIFLSSIKKAEREKFQEPSSEKEAFETNTNSCNTVGLAYLRQFHFEMSQEFVRG